MIPGVCSVPFSFFFSSLSCRFHEIWDTEMYCICLEFLRVYFCKTSFLPDKVIAGDETWNSSSLLQKHPSIRLLSVEINRVQVGVKWKLLFTCPVCIQQNTTCCLDLHCFDDPIEVVPVSASTGVKNPIPYNRPL